MLAYRKFIVDNIIYRVFENQTKIHLIFYHTFYIETFHTLFITNYSRLSIHVLTKAKNQDSIHPIVISPRHEKSTKSSLVTFNSFMLIEALPIVLIFTL